ncbi:MAG: DUF1254 domain-containing protein [Acidobacteriia bacterium]|nr:DUF1254 domain-containing protein [Terriglobia bacterium]
MRPIAFVLCAALASAQTPAEIRAIAEKAYTFAYPMVLMEYTRRAAAERGGIGGPVGANHFANAPAFPGAQFRQVIRPNADTLYSSAWLDLSKEPLILHVPDTHDRYYLMQFMDAWTETFSIPGKRTTGTGEGYFAIVGPGWKGTLPQRAQRIDSPTNMVWLLGRTQTNGPSDYEFVHAIQRGYTLMPLSLYPDGPRAAPARATRPAGAPSGTPPQIVEKLSMIDFFTTFAQLLAANSPHKGDEPMMAQLAKIGIVPGKPFDAAALGSEGAKAVEEGASVSAKRINALDDAVGRPGKTGWGGGGGGHVGRYGTDYAQRAAVARIGLGANPPEDAAYMHCRIDSEGRGLDGSNRYRIHFEKTPPVKAFWSLTMYSDDGYFIANPINRFAIGDRDKLKFNADGSVDIYIQHDSPGAEKESNWLPAGSAKFNLSLRMYWPGEEVISGKWIPPAVTREAN